MSRQVEERRGSQPSAEQSYAVASLQDVLASEGKLVLPGFGTFSVRGGRCSVYIPRPTFSSFLYHIREWIRRFLTLRLF